jgi:ABC-type amino acid transport substrate-binding protein
MDPDSERLETYDFSEPLLDTEFTIFTAAERPGVASVLDLRGLKVGVEEKGLPLLLLQGDPQIIVEIIPDFVKGFRMLSKGALDAVVADRWVGRYLPGGKRHPGCEVVRRTHQPKPLGDCGKKRKY